MAQFFKLSITIFLGLPCSSEKLYMNIRFLYFGIILIFTSPVFAQNLNSQNNADRLFDTGLDLIAHKEFGAAKQSFTDFLSQASSNNLKRAEAS
ncbi:MAG: hypothetical protein RIF39_14765, partial [Cyclobacteriaceae bacterium]